MKLFSVKNNGTSNKVSLPKKEYSVNETVLVLKETDIEDLKRKIREELIRDLLGVKL